MYYNNCLNVCALRLAPTIHCALTSYICNSRVVLFSVLCIFTSSHNYSDHTDEHLPDIMWCRDPLIEALNEIEDIAKLI